MHTTRALTISVLCAGGVSAPRVGCLLPGRVSALGGVSSGGVSTLEGCTWSWGVSAPGGVSAPRGVSALGGVPGPGGCTWSGTPPCGQTHACKHITLPQTLFADGN